MRNCSVTCNIRKAAAALAAAAFCVLFSLPVFAAGTGDSAWDVIAKAQGESGIRPQEAGAWYSSLEKTLKEKNGVLSENRYTEYSKIALAALAIGKDPENVGGYDLISRLYDYDKVVRQGINGPVWALIALDAAGKKQEVTAEYLRYLLERELPGGGWNMTGNGAPDPDVTAMVLQAFSNHRSAPGISASINRGIRVLSSLQKENGCFSGYGSENAESTAQVIIALCELGWSSESPMFVKNGISVKTALASYRLAGGEYLHKKGDRTVDAMATQQGRLAEAALWRYENHRGSIYDMGK